MADERSIELKLNSMWLEGRKINANISRFKRKEMTKKREGELII